MLRLLLLPFAVVWAAVLSIFIFGGCVAADAMRYAASVLVLVMTGKWEPTNVVGEVAIPRLTDLWEGVRHFHGPRVGADTELV